MSKLIEIKAIFLRESQRWGDTIIAECRDASENGTLLRRALTLALGLGVLQIVVGIANVLLRLPVEVTGTHSGLAALMTLTLGVAVRDAWKRPALELG